MRRTRALCLLSVLLIAACGGDDDEGTSPLGTDPPAEEEAAGTEATLLPCAEDRHVVAVDIVGFLTAQDSATVIGPWLDGTASPEVRAGAPETFHAYRARGYEVFYISLLPQNVVAGFSLRDMLAAWLTDGGFPMGPGTELWVPETIPGSDRGTWVAITDQLLALAGEGVNIDAAYTESPDYSYAYSAGGVPVEGNYSLTPSTIVANTLPETPVTRIPGDDLVAHAAEVQQGPPVCDVG